MKITVKEGDKVHRFLLPTSLLLSRLTESIILKKGKLDTAESPLSAKQLHLLFREVRRWRRKHGGWVLAEIRSGTGEEVTIKI